MGQETGGSSEKDCHGFKGLAKRANAAISEEPSIPGDVGSIFKGLRTGVAGQTMALQILCCKVEFPPGSFLSDYGLMKLS